ncbi:ribosomal protein S18-alanine N-acetyltransferase [Lederbergia wuyishanensis]|uniref:[Ribosomal protein bS18]-alanine N-acetyltransferase n=1 Tax=Lederbergia wuyishanensis TaxID=1347903 RepID=A0ABU0D797_9BACI|nr:ribosomal protein S18-alanine N-acetyltransferase [Lederbergia wuyishanensis]MCJ8008956.1 ribosomal protein S18-alanine N-acetyltransferase [Lederbergia wuyishanensis]MDQ0344284.1 ribosomal-protein-alanine N-acetyltransferase [Lederbergia wuyishanensis]
MIDYEHDIRGVSFRIATENDIDSLFNIEQKSFSVPWPKEAFYQDIISNRFALYLMMEYDGQVAGYCGVWLVMDEAHITNIAVLPEFRGHKLGEALLRKMMSLAKEAGSKTMTLEVRVSNIPARSLYKKIGFNEGGIRKHYYTDNNEDAIVMWVKI